MCRGLRILAGLAIVGVGLEVATGGDLSREARVFARTAQKHPELRTGIVRLVAATTELVIGAPPMRCTEARPTL